MKALPTPVRRLPGSAIRAAGASRRRDTLGLALGMPTWPLPDEARQALAAIDACGYDPHAGEPRLRHTIAEYEGVKADRVLVTSGAQGALFAITQAFLGPGDVALIPDPGFPAYRSLSELAGASLVPYSLAARHDFGLDCEAVLKVLERTPRAKVVFINHPANPTGGAASAAALLRLAEACARRGVLLVADEVYRELTLGAVSPSLAALADSALVVNSASKSWGGPGLRIGWIVGDPALLEPCRTLHATMVTSAAGPSQAAACALIEARDRVIPSARRSLKRRWNALAEAWAQATGRALDPPRGGIYHWFPTGSDDQAFCHQARDQAGVALVPGSAFGARGRGYARLCFGAEPQVIRRGVERLAPLLRTLRLREAS